MFWKIFTFPGRAIAWFAYMFPKQGDVWASARRVDSPMIHLLFSLMVYAGLGFVGFSIVSGVHDSAEASSAPPVMAASDAVPAPDAMSETAASIDPLYEEAPPPVSPGLMAPDQEAGDDIAANSPEPSSQIADLPPAAASADAAGPAKVKRGAVKAEPSPVDVQAMSPNNTATLRAELVRLLDSGPSERHGTWQAAGVQGELMVTPWRRTDGGVCRLYSFTARSADDMASSGYREACRTADGPWSLD